MPKKNDTPNNALTQSSFIPPSDIQGLTNGIRRTLFEGVWYFSCVDFSGVFADKSSARLYWSDTKKRLKKEGFELYENFIQLKLVADDGKERLTDVADAKTLLRIVQSISSPKAEPVKRWLAEIAHERIEEATNPNLGADRAKARYIKSQMMLGLSEIEATTAWQKRAETIDTFKILMDTVQSVVIGKPNYGLLVNAEYTQLFGHVAKELKVILETDSIRNALPELQLSYIHHAESKLRAILKHADRMQMIDVLQYAVEIFKPLGDDLRSFSHRLGVDSITGKPLLGSGV